MWESRRLFVQSFYDLENGLPDCPNIRMISSCFIDSALK